MGLFDRRRGAQASTRTRREDLARLREWSDARHGVEAYVEPVTSTSRMTLLLVAGDGESTRATIGSASDAADFARKAGIPIYDTNRVGIPQRKRDYDVRKTRGEVPPRTHASAGSARTSASSDVGSAPPAARRSPTQEAAVETLRRLSGAEVAGEPTTEQLQRMLRLARARSHPDRTGGDRTDWDRVEQAARDLNLEL